MAVSHQLDQKLEIAEKLFNIALVLLRQDERERAISCLEQVVGLCRELGYKRQLAYALNNLAMLSLTAKAVGQGHKYAVESFDICREAEDKKGTAWASLALGHAALDAGDWAQATALFKESESFYHSEEIKIYQLGGLARLARLNGETSKATRLLPRLKTCESKKMRNYLSTLRIIIISKESVE